MLNHFLELLIGLENCKLFRDILNWSGMLDDYVKRSETKPTVQEDSWIINRLSYPWKYVWFQTNNFMKPVHKKGVTSLSSVVRLCFIFCWERRLSCKLISFFYLRWKWRDRGERVCKMMPEDETKCSRDHPFVTDIELKSKTTELWIS